MTTTHTPGPWIVCVHPGDKSRTAWRQVLSTGGAFSPAFVCSALDVDAQLIAAAPDLLAALKCALGYIGENATDDSIEAMAARDVARAAIAKAEACL
jgi:hypothetical protein